MYRISISGGELFELIRPIALVLAALLSSWILTSAVKRFSLVIALACAVATFFLPLILGPLYAAVIILRRPKNPHPRPRLRRWTLSLGYALLLLISIGNYVVADKRSADAYIARASQARVYNDRARAIREYRSALKIENNAHTHKLLAIELEEAGMLQEAVDEFRLAEAGGEPDESISYRLGVLLEKLNLPDQATIEYRRFLASEMCTRADKDHRCESAAVKVTAH